MVFDRGYRVKIFFFMTGHTAPFPEGVEIFSGVKAETSQLSKAADRLSFIKCAVCLGAVLHHIESVFVGKSFYFGKFKGLSVKMYTDYRLCPVRDLFFYFVGIEFPGVGGTIDKYRCGACVGNAPCRGDKGVCRNDHFIASADTQRHHGAVQGGSTVVDAGGIGHTAEPGELLIKFVGKAAAGKSGFTADRLYGVHIFLFMFFIISGQINSFEHIFPPFCVAFFSG